MDKEVRAQAQDVLFRVVKGISDALSGPQYVLNRIYNFELKCLHFKNADPKEREELENRLARSLSRSAEHIALYLELLGLKETRQKFLEGWAKLGDNLG